MRNRRGRRPAAVAIVTIIGIVLTLTVVSLSGPAHHEAALTTRSPQPPAAGWTVSNNTITVDGMARHYRLARPPRRPHTQLPVLLVLHGRTMTAAGMQARTRFQSVIGPAIAVYPAGYGDSWNAGACCGPAHNAKVNDVAFLAAVVRRVLATQADASAKSVYLAGYSNGGRMAFRMACDAPGMFAGVAAVEAVAVSPCPQRTPTRMIVIASSDDPLLAVTQATPRKVIEGYSQPTVEDVVNDWRQADRCQTPTTSLLGSLRLTRWSQCAGNSALAYGLYLGGSHAWPAGDIHTPAAETVIWDLLRSLPLPASVPSTVA